jgi:predicted PurR-regulated permease PerM
LLPVSQKLRQWKVPHALSIIISIALSAAVFGGLIYFFYSQAASFADDWPELQKKRMKNGPPSSNLSQRNSILQGVSKANGLTRNWKKQRRRGTSMC